MIWTNHAHHHATAMTITQATHIPVAWSPGDPDSHGWYGPHYIVAGYYADGGLRPCYYRETAREAYAVAAWVRRAGYERR